MNETPEYIKEAAEEINLAANDLIVCSLGRLPQALPIQRIETILLKHWPKPSEPDETLREAMGLLGSAFIDMGYSDLARSNIRERISVYLQKHAPVQGGGEKDKPKLIWSKERDAYIVEGETERAVKEILDASESEVNANATEVRINSGCESRKFDPAAGVATPTEGKSLTVDEVVEGIRESYNEACWQLSYGEACRLVDKYSAHVSAPLITALGERDKRIEELEKALRLALIEGRHIFEGSWVERKGISVLGETQDEMLRCYHEENSNAFIVSQPKAQDAK